MKNFATILVLVLMSSAAFAAEKKTEVTLTGKDAAAIIQAFEILTRFGEKAEEMGVDYSFDSSQEGRGSDNVLAQLTTISGTIGNKSVNCFSQEFMVYKARKSNLNFYKPTFECVLK